MSLPQKLKTPRRAPLPLMAVAICWAAFQSVSAANLTVWDTTAPLGQKPGLEPRTTWKAVPNDLLDLEKDPAKAKSDPGYYGREYSPGGDIVVENRHLAAVFSTGQGRVILFGKNETGAGEVAGIVALPSKGAALHLGHIRILRNAGDEAVVEAAYSGGSGAEKRAVFSFDKTGIVAVKPDADVKGISVQASLARVVAPSFIADDLIISPGDYPDAKTLSLPPENVLIGLLGNGEAALTLTWPEGKQRVNVAFESNTSSAEPRGAIDIENDGQSIYLSVTRQAGVWHREELKPSYLEKEITSEWQRPFPAKWKTQLKEGDTRTTFALRDGAQEIWRGVLGSYSYPVWFEGDTAKFHLTKKIPPKGEAVIYFVEGRDTPDTISTPVEVMKATLGRALCDALIDPAGRALRTHHRRGGDGVHRACTCGCTEAIQAVFDVGQEVEKQDYISGAVDDMMYFIERHMARIEEYKRFAEELKALLESPQYSNAVLKPYVEDLAAIAAQIPQEYEVQKENMKTREFAGELARKTRELASRRDPENRAAYKKLLDAWRGMGGAQDYVVAQCHVLTRKLYRTAGYGCVNRPEALELAQEVRKRCRQALRNPDGYEIWPDY
ncbi:MAG TPA: hypothetical protein VHH73_03640 [Verrucomicrobiae bacterium]|nr:hypothetical protein [Verrucomicrobiae bacterium]